MTWTDLLCAELQALFTHEEDIVPTLERIRVQADAAYVHEVILRMIDSSPSRLGRLSTVLSFAGFAPVAHTTKALAGWEQDVDELLDHHPKSAIVDSAILLLLLKITRLRTAGYEAAGLIAKNLDRGELANLLSPLYLEDKEADECAAAVLAAVVRSGGKDWDEPYRLSQGS